MLHAAVAARGAGGCVAAHVHHGLQAAADAWPGHCERVAAALGVAFESLRVEERPRSGESVEAWARERRYDALNRAAARRGAAGVLTAHHADDQVETLLLRIARGTGLDGLAGIEASGERAGLPLLRPLLGLPRAALLEYAQRHRLQWVEDPSNCDETLPRNAFRRRVLPAIDAAAPAFRANLLRLAVRLDEAREAVDALACLDLAAARERAGQGEDALDADALAGLGASRRAAALRRWLADLGLRPPSEAKLREIERQLVLSSSPYGCVLHEGVALRRYRRAIRASGDVEAQPSAAPMASLSVSWRGESSLALPGYDGLLHFDLSQEGAGNAAGAADAQGVSADWLRSQPLTVRPGASSARMRPQPTGRMRSLKNLYQELGVPAWQRPRLPLVEAGGRVVFAAGVGMDRSPAWPAEGRRVRLRWSPCPV
ncbi:MAG TPA: tRNA lysidine(34) synthetase TilS [Quisquiliibacterium sp.]|nr:tRNA lysidine(34) synthetase TilS [Quisquiliibacterium sp.]